MHVHVRHMHIHVSARLVIIIHVILLRACVHLIYSIKCYIPLSDDFRQSACISFVQHFVEKYASKYTGNAAHAASKQQPVENGLTSSSHNNSSSDVTQVTRDATAAKAVLRYRVENYPKSH